MDKLQLKEAILNQIKKPVIPENEYSAHRFGIKADSDTIQTAALQNAIDMISQQGGGKLILPAGSYRTGALQLKSRVELHLASKDTILVFVNENPEQHYPLVFSHWEATPCYNYSPLIYACDASDIAVTGAGTLDGGADEEHWWNWHHQVENAWSDDKTDLQLQDRILLRDMNMKGISVGNRVFGAGHYLRPNFIQPIRCERVLIQGITLKNSPMWQINPVMCRSLTVDGVTMSSHGANSDGCDPESCSGVHICNCRFDTGDDCISLKSGRDRDGREANVPCEYVLIENNEFLDGHGGIALGSEMSGGIRKVLAVNNHFSSPNLTYALRLKTNARRGGRVENVILADSVIDHVYGAAVHGTMLYEDGRNGDDLPVFRNITIENIKAHGGDYGIFLEAFDEVPITGLVLRNIEIDGVSQPMRSMNWKNPVLEQVMINGKRFPRPGKVRILGVPVYGNAVQAAAESCGNDADFKFVWQVLTDQKEWENAEHGKEFLIPHGIQRIRVKAIDDDGNEEISRSYRILLPIRNETQQMNECRRLLCRGILDADDAVMDQEPIRRGQLANMLLPLMEEMQDEVQKKMEVNEAIKLAVQYRWMALDANGCYASDGYVTRQEMATIAMQACGVNYRNASSTMPVCKDAEKVSNNYGTNVARALYFGFMELDKDGCFNPEHYVTVGESIRILNVVADFAGI